MLLVIGISSFCVLDGSCLDMHCCFDKDLPCKVTLLVASLRHAAVSLTPWLAPPPQPTLVKHRVDCFLILADSETKVSKSMCCGGQQICLSRRLWLSVYDDRRAVQCYDVANLLHLVTKNWDSSWSKMAKTGGQTLTKMTQIKSKTLYSRDTLCSLQSYSCVLPFFPCLSRHARRASESCSKMDSQSDLTPFRDYRLAQSTPIGYGGCCDGVERSDSCLHES